MIQDILTTSGTSLTDINALAYGRGPGSFTGVRIGIGITQGLTLDAELPMIGVSALMTMAQGAWRKNDATRVLAAIDVQMGKICWAEYQRDENDIWHGEKTETVLKPEFIHERIQQLSGEWVTVGTGWQAWLDLGKESKLVLRNGGELLPTAEDILPVACQMFAGGKTVTVEHAEPVYLCNNVAWRKLPGKERILRICPEKKRSHITAVQKNVIEGILADTFALMLSGCVTMPDAIKGNSPTPRQDLVRAMSAPQLYVGQEARLGGEVVAVQNQQGKTRLEIATVPLDSGAKPTLGEPSRGRTYADVSGFLDPVDFRGQLVTVVGSITGVVDGKIGNTPYEFMMMQVTGYKRQHLTQQAIMPPQSINPWFYGGRGWPYGYGGWSWYNPGPAGVQTAVTE